MNNITFTWVYYLLYAPNQNHSCENFVSLDLFFLKMKEEFDAIQCICDFGFYSWTYRGLILVPVRLESLATQ